MSPTRKKGKRPRGRPVKPVAQRVADEATQRADGDRLREALNILQLSQAQAARLSGISQGHVTEFVSGKRGMTRADLRRLGGAGISADYVLGLTNELVVPGQSRTRGELEADLAGALARELMRVRPPRVKNATEPYEWMVWGKGAFDLTVTALSTIADRLVAEEDERGRIVAMMNALFVGVTTLLGEIKRSEPPNENAVKVAATQLIGLSTSLRDRYSELRPTSDGRPLMLVAESAKLRVLAAQTSSTTNQGGVE